MLEEMPKGTFIGVLQDQPPGPSVEVDHAPPIIATATPVAPEPATIAEDNSAPDLESIIGAPDFELAASKALAPKTWAFYSSAATDLVTHTQNKKLVRRVMIRPRILRNVLNVDYRTSILGYKTSAPFFISPTAMARLAHPDGELALARAAASEGIIQCVRQLSFHLKLSFHRYSE